MTFCVVSGLVQSFSRLASVVEPRLRTICRRCSEHRTHHLANSDSQWRQFYVGVWTQHRWSLIFTAFLRNTVCVMSYIMCQVLSRQLSQASWSWQIIRQRR